MRKQNLLDADAFRVQHSVPVRLFPTDYVRSYANADDQGKYSRIAISSKDLLVQPVLSSGYRSLLLHSFPIGHEIAPSIDKKFQVSSAGSATPYGTMHWRARGNEALLHPLVMGSAALRQFSITASLLPRDTKLASKPIRLPRGGIFQVMLIFCKDFSAK